MRARLIPEDDSGDIVITRDLTVVGRKRGLADVILEDPGISKLHCVIAMTDGLLFIRDLGSTNGTKVNGQKVSRGALLPGDEVTLARRRYKVFLGPGEDQIAQSDRTEVLTSFSPPLPPDDDFVEEADD